MSVLSNMVRERREWASSGEGAHPYRVKMIEFTLALSLIVLAFFISNSGLEDVQRVLTTAVEYARHIGNTVVQLFT